MENNNAPLNAFQHSSQGKDKHCRSQIEIIYDYLKINTATASMVEEATGVKQKNICRRKRELEKAGLLWEVKKENCRITGCKAWYLTTDPDKAPHQLTQFKLFDD